MSDSADKRLQILAGKNLPPGDVGTKIQKEIANRGRTEPPKGAAPPPPPPPPPPKKS